MVAVARAESSRLAFPATNFRCLAPERYLASVLLQKRRVPPLDRPTQLRRVRGPWLPPRPSTRPLCSLVNRVLDRRSHGVPANSGSPKAPDSSRSIIFLNQSESGCAGLGLGERYPQRRTGANVLESQDQALLHQNTNLHLIYSGASSPKSSCCSAVVTLAVTYVRRWARYFPQNCPLSCRIADRTYFPFHHTAYGCHPG